tara:strand:- start:71 stop:418 length:348 start_codon:yes stop_codon:yes gene_type:complete
MRPYKASLLNSLVLIVVGLYGFYSLTVPSGTALIAPIIGVLLLGMNDGIKNQNKTIAHIAVLLTLLSFALIYPLYKELKSEEIQWDKALRIGFMLLTSLIAMISFVQSFINARRA